MARQDTLRQTVAAFFETDPSQVGPDFPLSGARLQGSLARAKFYAAIQHRLGAQGQAVYTAQTYGELQAAVCGTPEFHVAPVPMSTPSNGTAGTLFRRDMTADEAHLACGIDIELVSEFPEAADYWTDPFYTATFTSAEIAYCLMQENPRMHFAARWCAKEALQKCDSVYLPKAMTNLEVAFDEQGAPFFRHYDNGVPTPLPFVVSISHTSHTAAAIVMQRTESRQPALEPPATPDVSQPERHTSQRNLGSPARAMSGWPYLCLSTIALLVAICAFVRTF